MRPSEGPAIALRSVYRLSDAAPLPDRGVAFVAALDKAQRRNQSGIGEDVKSLCLIRIHFQRTTEVTQHMRHDAVLADFGVLLGAVVAVDEHRGLRVFSIYWHRRSRV